MNFGNPSDAPPAEEADFEPWSPPPFEPESRHFTTDDGVRLHYLLWPAAPEAPLLLMLHGRRAHARWHDPSIPALSPRVQCACLDFRAHGESEAGGELTFERIADDIAQFFHLFPERRRGLLAHSMAGRPALIALERNGIDPELLVMADTPLARRPHHMRPEPPMRNRSFASREEALSRFRLMPGGTTANPDLLRHIAEHAVRQNPDGSWGWKFNEEGTMRPSGFKFPAFEELPLESARCPTLVIHGEHSVLMDAEDAQAIAERFPQGRRETVRGAHHHLMLDRPSAYNAALVRYLGERGFLA